MNIIEGKIVANEGGKKISVAIVASRFNEFITTKLVGGAHDALVRHDLAEERPWRCRPKPSLPSPTTRLIWTRTPGYST